MKFTWILVVLMIVVLSLSACGGQTPATELPDAAGDTATEQVTYPAPQALENPTAEVIASGAYPAPGAGEEISWDEAKTMILNGEINRVMQAHTMVVTLFTKDGRVLVTIEPNIDDVLTVVEECGDVCKDTTVVTE
jgi:predicted small lipoprotein YifL